MDRQTANELSTGAPGCLSIGNATLLVSQPSAADFIALRQYVRQRLPRPLQALAADLASLPPHLQEAAVKAAASVQASGSDLTGDRVQEELGKPEVCAWWVWMLARKETPGLTLEYVRGMVDNDNVFAVLADLAEATQLARLDPN